MKHVNGCTCNRCNPQLEPELLENWINYKGLSCNATGLRQDEDGVWLVEFDIDLDMGIPMARGVVTTVALWNRLLQNILA